MFTSLIWIHTPVRWYVRTIYFIDNGFGVYIGVGGFVTVCQELSIIIGAIPEVFHCGYIKSVWSVEQSSTSSYVSGYDNIIIQIVDYIIDEIIDNRIFNIY